MHLKELYHDTALRLLSQLELGDVPPSLLDDLKRAGAIKTQAGRLLFPKALVETAIERAAKKFILHGCDDNRSIEVEGERVYFGTGGAAVQTLDLKINIYRHSTPTDLHHSARLQDKLANISWFTRC